MFVAGNFDYPSPEWDSISNTAKQFIRLLLQVNPARRPTAREALGHPWFQEAKVRGFRKTVCLSV